MTIGAMIDRYFVRISYERLKYALASLSHNIVKDKTAEKTVNFKYQFQLCITHIPSTQ